MRRGGLAIGWLFIAVPAVLGIIDVMLRAGMVDDLHVNRGSSYLAFGEKYVRKVVKSVIK